ncbi:MAG TPA: WD40 repeat domain-containing protein [Phycisphaerales bacterium]|nr:WD40 repeat domain-containing protein [Phycisphaerales bacterium]
MDRGIILGVALGVAAAVGFAGDALAGGSFPGNPLDMYVTSDTANEVYQYERSSPWSYVPGAYSGIAKPQVFSNQSQFSPSMAMYLGCVAGPNQNFWIGGFSGLTQIHSTTGANVSSMGGGTRIGPATAPNGNVVVGGPTGVEEYDSTSGAFVCTVNGYGDGYNMFAFSGNTMYTTQWSGGSSSTVKVFDFVTGSQIGADISVPFAAQKLAIGPDGALYASALYTSPAFEGVYRWNGSAWGVFASSLAQSGTGPHGFAWDPVSLDLYMAFQTGEIHRYDGLTGAYLNTIDTVQTKLTDIFFKRTVPTPGAVGLLCAGGLLVGSRRRR